MIRKNWKWVINRRSWKGNNRDVWLLAGRIRRQHWGTVIGDHLRIQSSGRVSRSSRMLLVLVIWEETVFHSADCWWKNWKPIIANATITPPIKNNRAMPADLVYESSICPSLRHARSSSLLGTTSGSWSRGSALALYSIHRCSKAPSNDS